WLVAPGDRVTEDQPIVEGMTDKATVTITAPKAGKIVETRGWVGGIVPVHSVLVVFDVSDGEHAAASAHADPARPGEAPMARSGAQVDVLQGPAATAVGDIKEHLPGMGLMHGAPAPAKATSNGGAPSYFNAKPLATPATRKLARDLGVDLRTVPPTGPNGRVTKDDVKGLESHGAVPVAPLARTEAATPVSAPAPVRVPQRIAPAAPELEQRPPPRGPGKRICEGMGRSKHTAAHFTFAEECAVTALKALRARLKPAAEKAGVKLTFLPFFVKAAV